MLAYWRMDEGTGPTITDSSGRGFPLTFGNPGITWSSDHSPSTPTGFSLAFDGLQSGEAATAGVVSAFDFTSGFTLEAWVKGSSTQHTPTDSAIVGKMNPTLDGYMIRITPEGWPVTFMNGSTRAQSFFNLKDDQWHHLAAAWNGTNAFIYVDGVLQGSSSYSTAPNSAGAELKLGSYTGPGGPGSWTGLIDEVRIFNFARTVNDILGDMSAH
jgi:hypothetical protein